MRKKIKGRDRLYSIHLVNKLLDDTSRLLYLQHLLEIASDQLTYSPTDLVARLELLIDAYLMEARPLVKQIVQTSQALQNLPPTSHD